MKKSILFLDVDGVLRTEKSDLYWSNILCQPIPYRVFDRNFSDNSVKNVNEIIAYTRAKIVITSTWRNNLTLLELKDIFLKQGINGEIIGKTENGSNRGEEILDWIDTYNVTSFVVIDDQVKDILNYIPKKYVVKIDPIEGFDDSKLVNIIIDILL